MVSPIPPKWGRNFQKPPGDLFVHAKDLFVEAMPLTWLHTQHSGRFTWPSCLQRFCGKTLVHPSRSCFDIGDYHTYQLLAVNDGVLGALERDGAVKGALGDPVNSLNA
jgi:hypothetical protein